MTADEPRWALGAVTELLATAGARPLVVFLDYDGTLTPIVAHPEDAHLDEGGRAALAALAARVPVAVISGRDLADVRARVGLDELIYAGSHGFEIEGPGLSHEVAPEVRAELEQAADELRAELPAASGLVLEPKRYGVAVHWRMTDPAAVPGIRAVVDAVIAHRPRLRLYEGKKVFELQPDLPWDKGEAVTYLLEALAEQGVTPRGLYLGDDRTDEDAFRVLRGAGASIVVWDTPRATDAGFWLRDPDEVTELLRRLTRALGG